MTEPAGAAPAKAGALLCVSIFCVALGGWTVTAAADPRTDYMLDCRGCHGPAGAGITGKVPDMRDSLAALSATPAGRRYLVEVPGVAQAPLSNLELVHLLNWMVGHLGGARAPKSFRPFTAGEVTEYRKTPLVEVASIRRRLLAASRRQRLKGS